MSVMGNINYVKRVFAHPCASPDIAVLIETAFPAAAVALMDVFTFGCRDIQKMRAGRTPWHSRSFSTMLKSATKGQQLGPRMWGFAIAFAPVEAALQYWLFADVATGFIANWMSLIYQVSNCTLPGSGHITCGVQSLAMSAGTDYTLQLLASETRPCAIVGGDRVLIPAGCSATISWQLHYEPFLMSPSNYGTVTAWLEEADTGKRYSETEAFPQPGGIAVGGGGATVRAPFPGLDVEYRLKARTSGGIMFVNQSTLSVSAYGRPMKILPTGCKPNTYDNPYPHKPIPSEHEAKQGRPGNFFGVGGTIGSHR